MNNRRVQLESLKQRRPALGADLAGARRVRIQPGRGLRVVRKGNDSVLEVDPNQNWKHPWKTVVGYDWGTNEWVAMVRAGTVNGRVPTVHVILMGEEPSKYGKNPLTGEDYFSSDVFRKQASDQKIGEIDVPLYDSPTVSLAFRNIGWDGEDGVPQFFANLGVSRPRDAAGASLNGTLNADDLTPPRNNRLLRACDLVLHQPRTALSSQISLQPGIVTGISNVTQTLTVRSAAAGDKLKVYAAAKFNVADGSAIDPLANDYEERNYDEIRIATVYLLSRPGEVPGAMPDATWQPYIAHNLFWNLAWQQPAFRLLQDDPQGVYIPPLAGGAAQIVVNFFTSSLNDLTQQALNRVTAYSLAGHFWTPGMGTLSGEDVPQATVTNDATDNYGLNAEARAAAKRKAAALAAQRRMDPPFPHRGMPFAPELLN